MSFLLKYLKKKCSIAKSSKFSVKVLLTPVSFNFTKKKRKKCIHSKYIERNQETEDNSLGKQTYT